MSVLSHGNQAVFSCRGIEIAVNWFLQRGHTKITAFLPQWRQRMVQNDYRPMQDKHVLEELRERGHLVYTPARKLPGNTYTERRNICCYDDK